jgi:anti-sigma factor RsiW
LLHGYFDGELDLVSSLEVEEHLKTCPDCAQELRSQQTLRGALHSAGLYQRAPQRLHARIQHEFGSSPQTKSATRRGHTLEWLALAAAVAIVALTGVRIFTGGFGMRSAEDLVAQEVLESHVRSLQLGHLTDVTSTDQHTVKPWFDGKIDFAPPVNDFAAQGFPLIGGRLDYLDRHNVASLVYQRRKHLINVFIWPDETRSDQAPRAEIIDGYHLVHWRKSGMNFWLISDVSDDDEKQLVALLGG